MTSMCFVFQHAAYCKQKKITGYPTLNLYLPGRPDEPIEYTGPKEELSIKGFLEEQFPKSRADAEAEL